MFGRGLLSRLAWARTLALALSSCIDFTRHAAAVHLIEQLQARCPRQYRSYFCLRPIPRAVITFNRSSSLTTNVLTLILLHLSTITPKEPPTCHKRTRSVVFSDKLLPATNFNASLDARPEIEPQVTLPGYTRFQLL